MTITFELAWWWIPTAITVVGIIWAALSADVSDGYSIGILRSIFSISGVLCFVWMIGVILK